ncbi:MAG TPA: hypothetical protein VJT73_14250, partial [Polyangiaceae bacterium]|nr:hypothetical protein [Polyangiaceae bacterium]
MSDPPAPKDPHHVDPDAVPVDVDVIVDEPPVAPVFIPPMPIISLGDPTKLGNEGVHVGSKFIRRSSFPPPSPASTPESTREMTPPRARPPADSQVQAIPRPRPPLQSDPSVPKAPYRQAEAHLRMPEPQANGTAEHDADLSPMDDAETAPAGDDDFPVEDMTEPPASVASVAPVAADSGETAPKRPPRPAATAPLPQPQPPAPEPTAPVEAENDVLPDQIVDSVPPSAPTREAANLASEPTAVDDTAAVIEPEPDSEPTRPDGRARDS